MKTITIGKSGLQTSAIGIGTWAIGGGSWWGSNDDELSIRTIRRAIENGVTLIDTAPAYGFGHSEVVVGKALQDGYRDKVILSTKCGLWWHDNEGAFFFDRDGYTVRRNLSKRCIMEEVEFSLRRLKTDYIDIYFTHWQSVDSFPIPIAETMGALLELKEKGLIRAIGLSNITLDQIKEYMLYGPVDCVQQRYSIVSRDIEKDIMPFCEKNSITIFAYSPLEQGLLTGKYNMNYVIKPGEARGNEKWWTLENRQLVLDMIKGWKDLCEKYNCTLTNLVIAWTISQSENLNVLCGARSIEQIDDIIASGNIILDKADIIRMRKDAESLESNI